MYLLATKFNYGIGRAWIARRRLPRRICVLNRHLDVASRRKLQAIAGEAGNTE
jgi:hypothetical protein